MQLALCLKCGKPGVDNIDTRHDPHTGWIKRRKRCKACSHKWTSWEMPAATLEALRGGIDAARALFAGLGDLQKTLREAIAAADRLPDGFGDSGHVVEPLVPYEAQLPLWRCAACGRTEIKSATHPKESCMLCLGNAWAVPKDVPAVTGAAQWLRGERNIPPPTPESEEWPAHVHRICRTLSCDEECYKLDLGRRLCVRVAELGRLPTSEER